MAKSPKTLLNYPKELSDFTANLWLKHGTITITDLGSENTYYTDEFGIEYYCKNYPNTI